MKAELMDLIAKEKTRYPLRSRNYAIKANKFQFKELQQTIQRRTHKPPSTWMSSNVHPRNYPSSKINT